VCVCVCVFVCLSERGKRGSKRGSLCVCVCVWARERSNRESKRERESEFTGKKERVRVCVFAGIVSTSDRTERVLLQRLSKARNAVRKRHRPWRHKILPETGFLPESFFSPGKTGRKPEGFQG
jgi:hypothetical protein